MEKVEINNYEDLFRVLDRLNESIDWDTFYAERVRYARLAVFGSGMVLRTGAAHLSSSERILTGITFKESMGTTGSSVVNFSMKL